VSGALDLGLFDLDAARLDCVDLHGRSVLFIFDVRFDATLIHRSIDQRARASSAKVGDLLPASRVKG